MNTPKRIDFVNPGQSYFTALSHALVNDDVPYISSGDIKEAMVEYFESDKYREDQKTAPRVSYRPSNEPSTTCWGDTMADLQRR